MRQDAIEFLERLVRQIGRGEVDPKIVVVYRYEGSLAVAAPTNLSPHERIHILEQARLQQQAYIEAL